MSSEYLTPRVYRVEFQLDAFQSLLIDGSDEAVDAWTDDNDLDGRSKSGRWVPPHVYVHNPLYPTPDFWYVWGLAGIAIERDTENDVRDYLGSVGELLPLAYEDIALEVCNVTTVVDCLDVEKTERRASGVIARYHFLVDRLPDSPLFKIPETADIEMFCCSQGTAGEDLKSVVEQRALSGLRFVEVWPQASSGWPDATPG